MQDPMMFTTARPGQTSMLVALVNRAYSSRPEDAGWVGDRTFRPGERTDEAEVSELLADPRSVMLLGSSEGVTRSCVALTYRADSAYLSLFAVEPDRQGSGVGRLTMGAAETRLRQRQGIDHIGIHVLGHHSALIAWYRRLGYAPTGEHKPLTDGSGRVLATLIGMRKALSTVWTTAPATTSALVTTADRSTDGVLTAPASLRPERRTRSCVVAVGSPAGAGTPVRGAVRPLRGVSGVSRLGWTQ